MNITMVGVMLATSLIIGLLGLIAFLWGLKNGQFDDEKKMKQGVLFDNEEDLRRAATNKHVKKDKK